MIVACAVGNGVGVLKMDEKPIPSELILQADRSVKIIIKFIQRSGFILHLLLVDQITAQDCAGDRAIILYFRLTA